MCYNAGEEKEQRNTLSIDAEQAEVFFSCSDVFLLQRFVPFFMYCPHCSLFCPEAHLLYYKFWPIPRGWNNHMLWDLMALVILALHNTWSSFASQRMLKLICNGA